MFGNELEFGNELGREWRESGSFGTSESWPAGFWMDFWQEEQGQDLIEYSLLLAFVCLSGAAVFIGMGQTTTGLWSIVNSRLGAANQAS